MIGYEPVGGDLALDGLTAVVTGGAAGIGLATARFLVDRGVRVVVADRDAGAAAAWGADERVVAVAADLTSAADRARVVDAAQEAFGGADLLVNSAGIARLDEAEDLSEDDWDATMLVNAKASFFMAQAVARRWIAQGRPGSIVNLASQAGVVALDRHAAYCASKGAVIAMTKVLALEWGEHGIRVNAVSPTVVMTEMGRRAWAGPVGDAFRAQVPAGRFAEPDEIAAAIAFLCSRGAAMITGHNLVVDGGYTVR